MAIFIDTSFFIALLNSKDKYNERAKVIVQEIFQKEKFFTTDYVLDELFTFVHNLRTVEQKEKLIKIDNLLKQTTILEIEFVGKESFDIAKSYFVENPEVASFTDWASAVVMVKSNAKKILSFDSDFDTISNFPEFKGIARIY